MAAPLSSGFSVTSGEALRLQQEGTFDMQPNDEPTAVMPLILDLGCLNRLVAARTAVAAPVARVHRDRPFSRQRPGVQPVADFPKSLRRGGHRRPATIAGCAAGRGSPIGRSASPWNRHTTASPSRPGSVANATGDAEDTAAAAPAVGVSSWTTGSGREFARGPRGRSLGALGCRQAGGRSRQRRALR